jgi:hypothetical protein
VQELEGSFSGQHQEAQEALGQLGLLGPPVLQDQQEVHLRLEQLDQLETLEQEDQ